MQAKKSEDKVKEMMMATANKLVALVALHESSISGDLSFSEAKNLGGKVQEEMNSLYAKIYNEIQTDVQFGWNEANQMADELIIATLGPDVLETENAQRYFSRRKEAMDAFLKRKVNGLNLSDKVWKYTDQFQSEIELALNVSIGEGLSAQKISQKVRGYLQNPDKLFRRVRDKKSHLLKLSKAAKAYHPGRGVYRSAYKNAMRLARTETNIAYRTADCDRWQAFDFVLGYEVKTAGGDNVCKTCEALAGKYPKTFKFTGWHPHCRCFMIPITAQGDDWKKMKRAMVMGEKYESPNVIKDAPQFTKWAEEHKDAIEKAKKKGTLAYFLKDNPQFLEAQDITKMRSFDFDESCFSGQRKGNATWHQTPPEACDDYFHTAVEFKKNADKDHFESMYWYTTDGGCDAMNPTLRGGHNNHNGDMRFFDEQEVKKLIDNVTESLDANRIEKDIWLKRDAAPWNVEYIFGLKEDELSSYIGRESELIGKTGKEQAFLSCGSCENTKFGRATVEYKIYCPKGTPAIYGEPFSAFGGEVYYAENIEEFGLNWDGVKKPKEFNENEVLLQRGAKFEIKDAKYDGKKWKIELELKGFDVQDYIIKIKKNERGDSIGYYCEYQP